LLIRDRQRISVRTQSPTSQQVLHYSALRTGVSYLPLAVGIIIAAGLASALTSRLGAKPVLIAGLAAIAGGMVWFSNVHAHGSYSSRRCPARSPTASRARSSWEPGSPCSASS
jgi:hypothetical protein